MQNTGSYVLETTNAAVRLAEAAGTDLAEAYMQYGTVLRCVFQDEHLISQSHGWQNGLALRSWCQQKVALLTTNDFSISNLQALSTRARQEARTNGVPSTPLLQQAQAFPSLCAAKALPEIPIVDKVAAITELLRGLKDQPLLADAPISACYSETAPWIGLANSQGFQVAHQVQRSALWLWAETSAGLMRDALFGPTFANLDFSALAARFHQQAALLALPADKAPPGSCQILLSPAASADLALALGSLLTGENVMRYLPALLNYMGKKIATSAVTLIDDGTLSTGLHGQIVDDEGTRTQETVLIEKGRLRSLLYSLQTAHQLEAQPNGAATRAMLWQEPRSAPSTIYLQAGTVSPEMLLQQMRRGIAVTNVLRPGRVQNETGKFTLTVQGWWIEHGEKRYAISGAQIAANIFELVRNISSCGNDLAFFYDSSGAGGPSILVEEVQISQEGAGYV